jgi:TPR repeat protein
VDPDERLAFEWCSKAAMQGHAEAQSLIGTMYAAGRGTQQNEASARKWRGMASNQGNANAQFVFDTFYPDPVNGPRFPKGVAPSIVKFMGDLAEVERLQSLQNRHERRAARRRNRQRRAGQR